MNDPLARQPSREDIINACLLILGRPPENEFVISKHLEEHSTVAALRNTFFASREFGERSYANRADAFNIMEEYQKVDVEIDASQQKRLLEHIQSEWKKLGANMPYWSVLTRGEYAGHSLKEEKLADFYASGGESLKYIRSVLKRANVAFPEGDCLEYGCGAARNLVHLAPFFKNLVGIDISQPLLDLAAEALRERNIKNVSLKKLSALSQINYLGEFQFIFSVIVLQHNPPPIIAAILEALFGLLAPGGLILFQCPVVKQAYEFNINKYLDYIEKKVVNNTLIKNGEIEMHGIPQSKIFEIAKRHSCYPLEVHCDNFGNTKYVLSQSFLFKK